MIDVDKTKIIWVLRNCMTMQDKYVLTSSSGSKTGRNEAERKTDRKQKRKANGLEEATQKRR